MNNKTLAILSYVPLIGWLVSFFSSKDVTPKSPLVKYHLKQGLGIFILAVIFNIGFTTLATIVPALSFLSMAGLVFLVLMVFGIINAMNEQLKPIPVVGKFFEDTFSFLN